jgi:hypothetical protein
MIGIALLIWKPKKGVKTMNTVSVSTTQLVGAIIGLLVTVAAIIVNVEIFGSDLSLINMASYVMLGVLVVLTMIMLVKD